MFASLGTALLVLLPHATSPGAIEIHVLLEPSPPPAGRLVATTLPEALALLGKRRADGDHAPARIVVHEGRHGIEHPLVIDAALAGEGLTIEAAPNSTPTLSGGLVIEGLRAHDDGTWRTTIPAVRGGEWWFEELFADTAPRRRARHPNADFVRVVTAGPDNRTSFTIDPAALPPELVDDQSEVVFFHDWSTSRIRIAEMDATTNTIRFSHPIGCKAAHYAITNFEPHPRFYIEGSPRLVDAPGEWALHRETGELVYMPHPGEVLEETRLVAPFAAGLLRVVGTAEAPVANVRLRGLRFAHVNWPIPSYGYAEGQAAFYEQRDDPTSNGTRDAIPAALEFVQARDCAIERCVVAAVGGSGIWMGEGARGCSIADTIVRDAGANGILLGETGARLVEGKSWTQSAPDQVATGNRVDHCLIERCGRRFFGAVGVWIGLAEKTTVAHCEIRELPYTGVSVGWRWDETPTPCRANVIEGNHIHDVMQTLSDGGGIYTLGRQPGTVLRGNAIHGVHRNAGRAPSNGIFFDQGTMELVVEDNVFWAIDTTPIRWHWTYENTVRHNTFVLREGQRIAHYNRATPEQVAYEDNLTPAEGSLSTTPAEAIRAGAGPHD